MGDDGIKDRYNSLPLASPSLPLSLSAAGAIRRMVVEGEIGEKRGWYGAERVIKAESTIADKTLFCL